MEKLHIGTLGARFGAGTALDAPLTSPNLSLYHIFEGLSTPFPQKNAQKIKIFLCILTIDRIFVEIV